MPPMPPSPNPPASIPTPERTDHWLVRMNHRNRTFFYALLFLALGAHFRHTGAGPAVWVVLVVQFLVYPQLAYWTARSAPRQAKAELRNMVVDNLFGGLWAGLLGMPVWITFTLFIGNCINVVAFHGYPGLLRLVAAMGCGLLGGLVLYGDRPLHPDIDTATSLLCILALTLFLTVFAHTSYRRAMEQQKSNDRLREQFEEIRALQDQLQEQAVRDPLTGLYNRRHLDATLASEIARCGAQGLPLSLMMIDIDHFKRINDTHGHAAGDAMLQALAQLLQRHVRVRDLACRLGGEEFVLLPETPLAVARERAEALREAFEALQVRHDPEVLSATLSCGVAAFPQHARQPLALTASADEALYAAKMQGRNRVVVQDEPA
ncbi:sensor domain-containing diguanylate cyclase [Paracidovorax citrulli]|uniref:sensor domain-containing diguanylate cyclase n=1 Tax=Paracidovorax citrulli TaxID=80869 RepID=UPI000ADDF843|nr:sensor domain-containing diguanylate cyclase [Paracidovorax citrulli]